jgi:hypothetical protein
MKAKINQQLPYLLLFVFYICHNICILIAKFSKMKKQTTRLSIFFLFFIFQFNSLFAQIPPSGWKQYYLTGTAQSISVYPDGYGLLYIDSGLSKFIRTDLVGNVLKKHTLGAINGDIAVLNDSTFIVANIVASTVLTNDKDFRLQKINQHGTVLWEKIVSDSNNQKEAKVSIGKNGQILVASTEIQPSTTGPSTYGISLWFFDENGEYQTRQKSNYEWLHNFIFAKEIFPLNDSIVAISVANPFAPGYHEEDYLLLFTKNNFISEQHLYVAQPYGRTFYNIFDAISVGDSLFVYAVNFRGSSTNSGITYNTEISKLELSTLTDLGDFSFPSTTLYNYGNQGIFGVAVRAVTKLKDNYLFEIHSVNDTFSLWKGDAYHSESFFEIEVDFLGQATWDENKLAQIFKGTPDDGAILTGNDDNGLFLQKFDYLGSSVTKSTELTSELGSIFVFPNPSFEEFRVTGIENKQGNWFLRECSGRLIQQGQFFNEKEILVKRNNLASGLYFLQITTNEGYFKVIKVVFQ